MGRDERVTVRRYSRGVRWFHAGVYVTVLVLLATGWWLMAGQEGEPSPLARVTGLSDTAIHTAAGWALAILVAVGLTLGARATRTFVVETLRYDRGDGRWFARWPAALLTGRFRRHEGHFDPGQRIANVVLVLCLAVLIGSGVGLALVGGGPSFVLLRHIHQWSTWLITPVLIGHIVIASGLLPGYRGVARAMHFGGRLPVQVAKRVWPGWAERSLGGEPEGRPVGVRSQQPR